MKVMQCVDLWYHQDLHIYIINLNFTSLVSKWKMDYFIDFLLKTFNDLDLHNNNAKI